MAELGCGDHRVFIHERGNLGSAVIEVPWTGVDWARVLDDTSAATVRAGGGCCAPIHAAGVGPWSHEVIITRSPGGRVWSGPLVEMRDTSGEGLVIEARDLSAWHDRRRVHTDQFHTNAPLTDIYQAIWDDSMQPDPVPGYTLQVTPTLEVGDREILADQHMIAGDALRDLGRTGLDWTVIDRVHHVGGEEVDTPPVGVLIDGHFTEPPDVIIDGAGMVNDWVVSGAGGGAEGDEVVGTAPHPGPLGAEGLLEGVASEPSVLDQTSADEAAEQRRARTAEALAFIRGGVLTPQAPFDVAALVPGARVQVALTGRCIPVLRVQRLTAVRVSVTVDDDGRVTEKVAVELEPPGVVA